MDKSHLLNIAGRYMTHLEKVNENIFKGTLDIGNKTAGVYFFDFNNKPIIDFEAYQETLLAKEFYAIPGNLQWNYYLFLLNDQLKLEEKDKIERNDKYARKYVLNEGEFADFFVVEKSDARIKPNIVADWKQRLDRSGLKDVYATTSYAELLRRFKSSQPEAKQENAPAKPASEADKIQFINRLELSSAYREFPLQRSYDFGKVNLFRGINGVGKTSLFEAIEALVCGKCLRNPNVLLPPSSIQAEFNHSKKLTPYDGKNNKLFQARDLDWYATNTNRGSNLYNSFNRFNYFNADAAQSFSNANTEAAASEALYSIILGPEYHYISERCGGALDRFRPEYNRLDEEVKKARTKAENAAKIVRNYVEPKSIGLLRETIFRSYADLDFLGDKTQLTASIVEENNNRLRGILTGSNNSFKYDSLAIFKIAEKEFKTKQRELDIKETELRGYNDRINELTAREKRLNRLHEVINRCIVYIQDEKAMQLADLQQRENSAVMLNNKLKFIRQTIGQSTSDRNDKGLQVLIDEFMADIGVLTNTIRSDDEEMATMLESVGKIAANVQQIKSQGRTFLTLDPNACDCPLCQANYSREELSERILTERTDKLTTDSTGFKDLSKKLDDTRSSLSNKESILKDLRNIKLAYDTAYPNSPDVTPVIAVDQINDLLAGTDQAANELQTITELKRYASTSDLSEKEFRELKLACSDEWADKVVFEYGQLQQFQTLLDENTTAISNCKKDQTTITEKRTEVGNQIKNLVGVDGGTNLYLKDIREIIKEEETEMQRWRTVFDSLLEVVGIDDSVSLVSLQERSNTLQNNLSSIRQEQRIQFDYETAVKDQGEALAFLDANSPLLKRYQKAVSTLKELTGDEAQAHVTAFFDENFAEIIDIFKSIHVPKEFKTLTFKEGKLELTTETDEKRTVSQISTGQRSALALSIFLALNSKLKNGPDLVMFDDPVAFIDDLNALSFLDHLRLHVLKNNKQIFFATANMRLAGLFEKKFSFMESDFQKFEFRRSHLTN